MLVTMKSILEKANEDNYGIMAMNLSLIHI